MQNKYVRRPQRKNQAGRTKSHPTRYLPIVRPLSMMRYSGARESWQPSHSIKRVLVHRHLLLRSFLASPINLLLAPRQDIVQRIHQIILERRSRPELSNIAEPHAVAEIPGSVRVIQVIVGVAVLLVLVWRVVLAVPTHVLLDDGLGEELLDGVVGIEGVGALDVRCGEGAALVDEEVAEVVDDWLARVGEAELDA